MMRRHSATMVLLLVLLLTIGQLFTSCDKSDSPVAPAKAYNPFQPPKVDGIWLTDASGLRTGAWGEPIGFSNYRPEAYGKPIPSISRLHPPYQNPSKGTFEMVVSMAYASDVRITVIRGIGPGETWESFQSSSGAVIPALNYPVFEYESEIEAGGRQITIYLRKAGRLSVPIGFYRIYVQAGNYTDSVDVFLYNNCSDLPPHMPGMDGECK